jgi:hypothetical protein
MRRIAAALVLLLLAACAEVWTRPGTTEAEAEAANASCGEQASLAVPVQLVWTIIEPGGYDRDRRCWRGRDGREYCDVVSRYRPPRYGYVDVNEGPRDGWRRQCMRAKGFEFQGLRPLRLQ